MRLLLTLLLLLFTTTANAAVSECYDGGYDIEIWASRMSGYWDECFYNLLNEDMANEGPMYQECVHSPTCNPFGQGSCCDATDDGWNDTLATMDYIACDSELTAIARACDPSTTIDDFNNSCSQCGEACGQACLYMTVEIFCGDMFDSCAKNCNEACSTTKKTPCHNSSNLGLILPLALLFIGGLISTRRKE